MAHNVLIVAPIGQEQIERLLRISPEIVVKKASSPVLPEEWREAEIAFTVPWKLPTPEQVPHLRWLQLYSAGADRFFSSPLRETDIMVTTTSGLHVINIAEYVLGMVQAWYRKLPQLLTWKQGKNWGTEAERTGLLADELDGKTIGIVGYGSIGRQVARLAQAYGLRILAIQRGTNHKDTGFQFAGVGDPEGTLPQRYYAFEQLHDMLRECDIVVAAVPLTNATREMFDALAFQAMKNNAFFVNIARGEVCDEKALVDALAQKQIAGAALDVFSQEPLPSTSPLWNLPNVLMSPHNSGPTPHYNQRATDIFIANLQRYLAQEPMYNLVDKQSGY